MPVFWAPYGVGPHPDEEKRIRDRDTVERTVTDPDYPPWRPGDSQPAKGQSDAKGGT